MYEICTAYMQHTYETCILLLSSATAASLAGLQGWMYRMGMVWRAHAEAAQRSPSPSGTPALCMVARYEVELQQTVHAKNKIVDLQNHLSHFKLDIPTSISW